MYLSTASSRLMLCDVNSWDFKKSYGSYDDLLRDISWSDDGKYMLQVNPKGLVEILATADQDIQSLQHIPLKDTWSANFHRDGHRNIAIGTKNGGVLIWDTKNKAVTKTFPTPSHQSAVNFVSYNAKNTSLAASMQNGDTVIYGLVSNIPVLTIKLSCSKSISAMKFHHDSRSLLGLATEEGHIILRDITTNKDKAFFENIHASPVSDMAYSLVNKDVVLSCGFDKIMNVYDARMQSVVFNIRTSYTLTSIAINMDNQVALGTKNGLVLIYDLRDLTNPFKILKGHKEEVHRVAFQPIRKKMLSADVSLKEFADISSQKMHSPVRNRTSDMFFMVDTPPKNILDVPVQGGDAKADSFLVMLGLDKSNDDGDGSKSLSSSERKSDKQEVRYNYLETTRKLSKVSTPLNNRVTENFAFPSPALGTNGDTDNSQENKSNFEPNANINMVNIDNNVIEELKDDFKLILTDVSEDNKNYFLHIMMQLTKQKLFLEKQLSGMNEQIQSLVQNQNTIIEINRKLVLEIEKLKCQKN